ncbi:glutaredoxin-1 [Sigmodon hispidus]
MAQEFVNSKIHPGKVVVFIKPTCPYCQKTQAILKQLPFKQGLLEFVDITATNNTNEIQDYLQQITGARTVPRVFIAEWRADDPPETDRSTTVMEERQTPCDSSCPATLMPMPDLHYKEYQYLSNGCRVKLILTAINADESGVVFPGHSEVDVKSQQLKWDDCVAMLRGMTMPLPTEHSPGTAVLWHGPRHGCMAAHLFKRE